MPRHPRFCIADTPIHVVQRGHNRGACFASNRDRVCYLAELKQQADLHGVAVHAYVLMTNHVHLLMTPGDERGISRTMKALGESYVRYFNGAYGRTGTLWESRPYSCLVDTEGYLLTCHRYIECNPVRAGLAMDPQGYQWSSHRANALGEYSALLSPHPVMCALGNTPAERQTAYRELFQSELDSEVLDCIRDTTRGGFALGGEGFQRKVSEVLGKPAIRRKAGRPPGKK